MAELDVRRHHTHEAATLLRDSGRGCEHDGGEDENGDRLPKHVEVLLEREFSALL